MGQVRNVAQVETRRSVGRLAVSYVIGMVICGLIFTPFAGSWSLLLSLMGLFVALPMLGIAAIVLTSFHHAIMSRLTIWCNCGPGRCPGCLAHYRVLYYL